MSDRPVDPSDESTEQGRRETSSYAGQQGYGVEYENGQYQDRDSQQTPVQGRSGSFETNNLGGYGTGQPDADNSAITMMVTIIPPKARPVPLIRPPIRQPLSRFDGFISKERARSRWCSRR